MTERNFLIEVRSLLLSFVAMIESYIEIKPTTAELRKKGQEYVTLLSKGLLGDSPTPPTE